MVAFARSVTLGSSSLHQPLYFVFAGGLILSFAMTVSVPGVGTVAATIALVAVTSTAAIFWMFLTGAYQRRPVSLALHLALVYWFFWPAVWGALDRSTNVLNTGHLQYVYKQGETGPAEASTAMTFILLFAVAICGTAWFAEDRIDRRQLFRQRSLQPPVAPRERSRLMMIGYSAAIAFGLFLYLAMSSFRPSLMIEYILDGRSGDAPWNSNGIRGSGLTTVRNVAIGSLLAGASALLVFALLRRRELGWKRVLTLVVVALGAALVTVIESGSRTNVILALVPAGLAAVTIASPKARPNPRVVIGMLLLGALVVGSVGIVSDFRKDNSASLSAFTLDPNDNDFFTATMLAVETFERTGVEVQSPLAMAAIQVVPNRLYPGDKPYPSPIVRATMTKLGTDPRDGGSQMMPSIVGQYLMSYGPGGPLLIGAILGLLAAFGDSVFGTSRAEVVSLRQLLALQMAAFLFLSYRALMGAFSISLLLSALIAGSASLWVLWRHNSEERRVSHDFGQKEQAVQPVL